MGAFAFGCFLVLTRRLRWRYSVPKLLGYFFIVVALIETPYRITSWYVSHRRLNKELASGSFAVAKGTVQDFRPMPDDRSSPEMFTVSGHEFSYGETGSFDNLCFRKTSPDDEAIHAGMYLQVKYVDRCILEIDDETDTTK